MTAYGTAARIKSLSGILYTDLGLGTDAAWDAIIAQVNDAVSRIVDGYCGRDFDVHTDDEVEIRGQLSYYLRLPHRPVISVASIHQDTTLIPATEYRVSAIPGSVGLSSLVERYRSYWSPGVWYKVKYTWGFTTTPADVVRVVEDMALDTLRNMRDRYISGNASATSMGGFSVSIEDHLNHDPKHLARLDHYRQVMFG
jgi:hypothetical protein